MSANHNLVKKYSKLRNIFFLLGGIIFVAGCLYCLLGAVMTASFSATPNYDISQAKQNLIYWLSGAILSGFLSFWLFYRFIKKNNQSKSE